MYQLNFPLLIKPFRKLIVLILVVSIIKHFMSARKYFVFIYYI